MTEPKRVKIVIPLGGSPRAIYSADTERVFSTLGETVARRASHVEPATGLRPETRAWLKEHNQELLAQFPLAIALGTPKYDSEGILTHWNGVLQFYADLQPVKGPVLGPFASGPIAVAAEVKWLEDHGIPFAADPPPA